MTREEAIQILRGAIKKPNTKDGYLGQAIDLAIKALEQAPRWISVSERLPEDNETYLVTVELTFARGERYVNQYRKDSWDKSKEYGHEIIAWMPLPEPYKAESEDKE